MSLSHSTYKSFTKENSRKAESQVVPVFWGRAVREPKDKVRATSQLL